MAVKITLTNVGYSISSTLDLYSNETGSWGFLETVSKNDLIAGYTFIPPVDATAYQIRDTGQCGTVLDLVCETTTSTTTLPITTTTTTTIAVYRYLGINYSITSHESPTLACEDDSCSTDDFNCISYYSYYNTLNINDILYQDHTMIFPIEGGNFYFSLALTSEIIIVGDKTVVQLDDDGKIIYVGNCNTTTTTTTSTPP